MDIEKIMSVDSGRFDLTPADIVDILKEARQDASSGIILAFHYGFMRGQRAEKARAKKKAVTQDNLQFKREVEHNEKN